MDSTNIPDLFVQEMRPASQPKGAFLFVHGMESHSGWFMDCADRLVRSGYAAVLYDRPGWGKSPGERGHLAGYGDFLETLSRLASGARERYGAVHLAGMSWGGMAALYAALRRPWLFDSAALLAPGITSRSVPLRGGLRVAGAFFRNSPAALLSPVCLPFQPEDFTGDPARREFIRDDPDRVRAVTASFCMETVKMRRFIRENAGRRAIPPTLCLLAGSDAIIDNRAVGALCAKAGALVGTIPDCAHTLIFERPGQTASLLLRHAENAAPRSGLGAPGTVWVAGAGAIGGMAAAMLAFGGVRVGVLVKPRHMDALTRDGITLQTGEAVRTARVADGLVIADAPEGLPPSPDLVILAVKSFDTPELLRQLAGRIPPGAVLASLQNGVDNEELIARAFPSHTVIAGSICASVELAAPGRIHLAGDRGGLGGAAYRGDAGLAESVWTRIMPRTGMECRWYGGKRAAARLKWSKLMLNIGFNALNSVTGLSSAAILRHAEYGGLAVAALREGFLAMTRQRLYPLDLPGFPVSIMRRVLSLPGGMPRKVLMRSAGAAPEAAFSMRQDILLKRQHTEIQALNGKIIDTSRELGLHAPANEKLVRMAETFHENNMA